jgi:hypothetical protein
MNLRRTSRYIIAIVLFVLALAPQVSVAQSAPMELREYEALLRAARTAAARGDRLDLEEIVARLEPVTSVRIPAGATAPLDNGWLVEALAVPNPNLPAVAEQLGALIDALNYVGPAAPPDALAQLDTILNNPPFGQPERPPREPGPIDRFFEWLFEQLVTWLEPVGQAAEGAAETNPDALAWVIVALGALLVLAVLVIWIRGMRRSLAPPDARLPNLADPEANLTPTDARNQARVLAAQGDYRTATRLLYLSALLWLDERRALRYERHLTNREYLHRLAERPELRRRMQPVVETFDRVWYGHQPLDSTGFADYERQVAELREAEERPTTAEAPRS